MRQPDLHYDGPLTKEFIQGLMDKIKQALEDIANFVPPDTGPDWIICQANWIESLRYAGLRCAAIITKLEHGLEDHRAEEDRKCIDITLCIIRDFVYAKGLGFQNADYQVQPGDGEVGKGNEGRSDGEAGHRGE